jgi:hypothetical protein
MRNKEPGLLRQIIAIHYEQAKRRKALRQLAKSEWTWEFLESVVTHAADLQKKDIEIVIECNNGNKISISSVKNRSTDLKEDYDIFNHLDDQAAVDRFIREHARK